MSASDVDPHILEPDHAPTPFSASEIRDGCPAGRTVRFLVEPAGAEPFVRVTRFVGGDDEAADHESQRFSLDGRAQDEPVRERSTWVEFQSHASFPLGSTVIADDVIEIPAGRFECLRYTVADGDAVDTFWFSPFSSRDAGPGDLRLERGHHDFARQCVRGTACLRDPLRAPSEPWAAARQYGAPEPWVRVLLEEPPVPTAVVGAVEGATLGKGADRLQRSDQEENQHADEGEACEPNRMARHRLELALRHENEAGGEDGDGEDDDNHT